MAFRIHGIILSCEHATNAVPREFRRYFRGRQSLLNSHRGFDHGAMSLARTLSEALDAPVTAASFTRLLIDANRSLRRRSLFSPITKGLDRDVKQHIIANYFEPHRRAVLARVRAATRRRRVVLHVGVHTFAPLVRGHRRRSDVSLLYDPARSREVEVALAWRSCLHAAEPRWRVRRNYPFLGKTIGLTGWLRLHTDPAQYLGLELEVNRRFHHGGTWRRTCGHIVESVERLLSAFS